MKVYSWKTLLNIMKMGDIPASHADRRVLFEDVWQVMV
jgi:hypothetical protein